MEEAGLPSCSLRLSFWRVLGEFPLAAFVAALASLAIQFPISRFGLSEPTALPEVAASASAAVILALLFLALLRLHTGTKRGALFTRAALPAVWVALSGLATMVLAWPLESTKLYYGGVSIDQQFRLQLLARLTESPALADMNYHGLPSFYPAGWFWVGGRFADFADLPAWLAFKPFAVLTIAVTSAGAFTLWSVVVRRRTAALLAVITTISGFLHGFDEPYAWMSTAWLTPVAVVAWHVLNCRAHRHGKALVGIGLFLGFAGITYTVYLAFPTLLLVTMAVIIGVTRIRAGHRPASVLRPLLSRLLTIGAVAAAMSTLVWTPFLLRKLVGAPSAAGAANRYLPPESMLPFPMFQPSLFAALCLIGFGWMVLAVGRSAMAAGLLTVVGSVYLWFGLSTLAIAAGTTLLAFRITPALEVALATAGVLGLLDLWKWVRTRLDHRYLVQATALTCLLGLGGSIAITQTALTTTLSEAAQPAYNDYYPTGHNSQRQADPSVAGAWNDEISTAIAELTARKPSDVVLLTTYYPILSFLPYWGFQQETVHYANPMAQFDARAAEVRRWASASSPEELLTMLDSSPFTPADTFLFRRAEDGLHITLSHDAFPHQPNVQIYDVRFDEALFAPFAKRDVGPFVVITVR